MHTILVLVIILYEILVTSNSVMLYEEIDGAGHQGISIHLGNLSWARYGVTTKRLFSLQPHILPCGI